MSSSIAFRKKSLSMDFVKRTAGLITGAAGEYISDSMPTITTSTSEIRNTAREISSSLANTSQDILSKTRSIKSQNPIREIYRWYMDKEHEFDDSGFEADLQFDTDVDASAISDVQINEAEKNANKVAKAVIQSSKQMVESQITSIANLQGTLDKQTAVIKDGFKETNQNLSKILEVLTKNTATLIETTVAASNDSPGNNMMRNGRFNAADFKKMVSSNIKNSPAYTMMSMMPMLFSQGVTPEEVVKGLFSFGIDKVNPNFKKNMKALDDAVNDTIMQSLIRLGNSAKNNPFSFGGILGSLIGVDASRKNQSTQRSSFEVKSVSFDSITREAITNAIPGYLRKILVAVGGEDVVYDYRSRNFRTQGAIRRDFINAGVTSTNSKYQASSTVRKALNNTSSPQTAGMLYEMLLAQLGSERDMTRTLESFKDPKALDKYMRELTKGVRFSKKEQEGVDSFMRAIYSLTGKNNGIMDIGMQASRGNVQRNAQMSRYIAEADKYNIDLSELNDSVANDIEAILAKYGKGKRGGKNSSSATAVNPRRMTGTVYTNAALYQIFRRLDEGINVYQVGASNEQGSRFEKWGDEHLAPPMMYRPRSVKSPSKAGPLAAVSSNGMKRKDDEPNWLLNQTDEEGNVEDLSTGKRVGRWAKARGGQLRRALWSGNPEEVRDAFGGIISDIGGVAGEQIKKGASKINESFGNVTGYLKHQMFGTEYTYTTMENGKEVVKKVPGNEKGGVFGFIKDELKMSFAAGKEKVSKWMNTVKEYFNFGGGGEDSEERDINSKRKKLIFGSVGAFAGAGILGGPIGMIMGALAGTALSSFGIGGKIKNFLFGHDEDGKPTGILSKAADAIVSPIKFQIGKTVSLIGATLKKGILGPLSDIGLAIKDKIHNHVASVFDKVKEAVGGFFKNTFGRLFKWIGQGVGKVAIGVHNLFDTTAPGKAARAGITAAGGILGGLQTFTANRIAGKNNFHKLKKGDENYVIKKGQRYTIDKKEILTADHDIIYDEAIQIGAMPTTRDYLDYRRKARKEDVDNDLRESGYYTDSSKGKAGKIKGFFGGDYKAWHEQELKNRQARRQRFKDGGYGGRESEAVVVSTEETAKNTSEIATSVKASAEAVENLNKLGSEKGSIFTHDEGLHERLDELISIMRGDKKKDVAVIEKQSDSSFANALIGAASQVSDEGGYNNEDISDLEGIVSGSQSGDSKGTMFSKFKRILSRNKNLAAEAKESETKEKESIFDKIFSSGLGSLIPALAALIPLLLGLFKNGGLGELIDRFGTSVQNIKDMLAGTSETDAVTTGMNTVTALADAQVNSSWDWANPFASIFHNKTDAAGNQIENTAVTEAKDEVLYKSALRKDLTSGIWNNYRAGSKLNKAIELEELANAQAAKGGFFNNTLSKINRHRSENLLDQAIDAEQQANAPKTNTINSLAKNIGRIGAINVVSGGLGNAAGGIATSLGASEETAQTIDNVTTAATSGAMTVNMATSALKPNKKSWVDKIVDGITKMLKWIGEKVGADKAFKKIGASKVVSSLTKFTSKISSAISKKLDDVLISKITAKLAAVGVKNAAAAATAGIAVAAGALAGLASGLCGVEHLFGVLPGEADTGMKAISGILGTVFGALEMTPVGWVIAIFDVIDAILVSIPGIETGIKQFIARELYKLMGDDAADASLAAKQEEFNSERQYYAEKYGQDLNNATFNDMVNNTGFIDRIWSGKAKKGEDGHLEYDDAGVVIKRGGIKNAFVGVEQEYVKDANGNVLKDSKGNAIKKIDAEGHTIKKDMKIGDHIGNIAHDIGGFFAGKTVYKTDKDGNVIYDENGNPVVDHKEKDIFGKAGDTLSSAWNSFTGWAGGLLGIGGKSEEEKKKEEENKKASVAKLKDKIENADSGLFKVLGDGVKAAKDKLSGAASSVLGFLGIGDKKDKKDDKETEKSESTISKTVKTVMNPITSLISAPFNSIKGAIDKLKGQDKELDEDGKPVVDADGKEVKKGKLGEVLSKGLNKITSLVTNPINDILKGAEEWEKSENPFKRVAGGAVSWIKNAANTVTGFFGNIFNNSANAASNYNSGGIGGPVDTSDETNVATTSGLYGSEAVNYNARVDELLNMYGQSSEYGYRTINGVRGWHNGVDFTKAKNSDVPSFTAGTVTRVDNDVPADSGGYGSYVKGSGGAYGNRVVVKDEKGNYNHYAHLNKTKVNVGDQIQVGQPLGLLGHTGNSTGAHLHYEVRDSTNNYDSSGPAKNSYNPIDYLTNKYSTTNIGHGYSYGTETVNSFIPSSNTSSLSNDPNATGSTGPLARLIEIFKSMGSNVLNFITGGLFGQSTSANTDSSITSFGDGTGYFDYTGYSGNITCVEDFLAMCAREIGNCERPAGSSKTKYNVWYYGSDKAAAWCMIFVQWCFNQAGLPLECRTASCSTFLDHYRENHPNLIVNDPKPGDVIIWTKATSTMSHTGIVEKVLSPAEVQTIEGNTGDKVDRKTRDRSKITAFIRVVDWDQFAATVNSLTNIQNIASGDGGALYDFLIAQGYTPEGAAGVLGNLYAESSFISKNLQGSYERSLGHTDDSYTIAVDNGNYSRQKFIHDSAGYGLAQWTYHTLKEKLYDNAKAAKVSIGDAGFQMAHLVKELSDNGLDSQIKYARSADSAARVMMTKFERPADQSEKAQSKRSDYASQFLAQYRNRPILPTTDTTMDLLGGPEINTKPNPNDDEIDYNNPLLSEEGIRLVEKRGGGKGRVHNQVRKQGIGGPDLGVDGTNSSISHSTYVPSTRTSSSSSTRSTSTARSSRTTVTPSTFRSGNVPVTDNQYTSYNLTGGVDNDELQRMLMSILVEMRSITQNTGSSSDLLGELNSKEFVDQGLRNSLGSISKNKNRSATGATAAATRTSSRTVNSLARPRA